MGTVRLQICWHVCPSVMGLFGESLRGSGVKEDEDLNCLCKKLDVRQHLCNYYKELRACD